jgi:hypothetical protein
MTWVRRWRQGEESVRGMLLLDPNHSTRAVRRSAAIENSPPKFPNLRYNGLRFFDRAVRLRDANSQWPRPPMTASPTCSFTG